MTTPAFGAPGLRLQGRDLDQVVSSSSAVTGFVGIAERGPMNLPQPIFSWEQFLQIFGDSTEYSYLADAVFEFFLNGGEKCWCVRVGDLTDHSGENVLGECPKVDLLLPASTGDLLDRDDNPSVRISAINEGSWGNAIRFELLEESSREIALAELRHEVHGGDTSFVLDSVYDLSPGQVIRIAHTANPFIQHEYTVSIVDPVSGSVTIVGSSNEYFPVASKVYGHGFRLVVRCGVQQEVFESLSMTPTHERYFPRVINGDADSGEYLTRLKRGNSILIKVVHLFNAGLSRFRPLDINGQLSGGGDGFTFARGVLVNASLNPALNVTATGIKGSAANGMRVRADVFTSRLALAVPLPNGQRDRFACAEANYFRRGETVTLTDKETPSISETATVVSVDPRGFVRLSGDLTNDYAIGSTAVVTQRFDLSVYDVNANDTVERFLALAMAGSTNDGFVKEELAANSSLLCADPTSALVPMGETVLGGGVDPGTIDMRYYTGYEKDASYFIPTGADPTRRLGLATLESIDEVSLVAVPDLSRGLYRAGKISIGYSFLDAQKLILFHCAKLGERMAILDLLAETSLAEAAMWPSHFNNPALAKFGALYYPWVLTTKHGANRWVPPCGVVAGAFSLSDGRYGLGKAPANLSLLGVAATQTTLDRAEHEDLNPLGVNCIRKLEDGQVNLMGSRTLATAVNNRYVNNRRVLLAIVKTLSKKLLWTVFEANNPVLWNRIEATLTSFFNSLVSKGITAGTRPGESYYVKCNAETNSKETINGGQVVAEIGVALTAPAEFILITARRTPESLNIVEEET